MTALESITRGEIDMQIATAHQYPRSMSVFKRRATDMVTIDEETAASCIYVRPVGKKKNDRGQWEMQYAEGLSIRMAEIVAASYGNLRSGSMIIEQTERYVKCRGFCHDLETNNAVTTETMEPTVKSDGSTFSEGMRAVVAKACLKKALRDSIFSVVPKALCRPIESEARKVMAGDAKSMEFRRQAVMTWVNKLGIDTARVFAALGVVGESDITTEHLTTLTGLKTAIKDGDIKIEEAFPPITEDTGETVKPDFLKKKAQDKPAETPPATPDPKRPATTHRKERQYAQDLRRSAVPRGNTCKQTHRTQPLRPLESRGTH
jgi:hypothetical protein